MLELIWFQGIPVNAIGPVLMGTLTNPNPSLYFVCEGGGFMKGIGTWTVAPVVRMGINSPSYNNISSGGSLSTNPLRGRNQSQATIRAIPSGTQVYLFVSTAGAISGPGTPVVDVYIAGRWFDLTTI